jgi:nucleoside-diphosphate-sugar epimerase
MLRGEKILITGPAGQIAFPMAEYLARDNEVWGIARFSEAGSRERVEGIGVTTRVVDLARGDFGDLPDDFTYVLHLATFQSGGLDYDGAIAVNAEGTGLLAAHCRKAKAMLVTSTFSLYKPNPDPYHHFIETDPLGDANQPHSPTYSISKIAQEAVARTAARLFELPTTIARVNVSYGPNGGLPAYHLDWMLAGQPITLRAPGPTPYSPISQDDMNDQVEPLLDAASINATIVNWGGDETITAEHWCDELAAITGCNPTYTYADYPGSIRGSASDSTRRQSITGPCKVPWRDGMRSMFERRYPEGHVTGSLPRGAERLLSAVRRDDPQT